MNRNLLQKRLSIGHNGSPQFKKILDKYHRYIHDVYVAPAGWVMQSTRPNSYVNNEDYNNIIQSHIRYCKENEYSIRFSLLLNSQCWNGEFRSSTLLQRIFNYIDLMNNCFDEFVVSDEFVAKELKQRYPECKISLSVISAVNDYETCAEMLALFPDFETICVGHKMTYQYKEMERIKKCFGKKVKLLINQGCYYNCPDYTLHSTALAHSHKNVPPMENGKHLYCDYINSLENELAWKNLTHQALAPNQLQFYDNVVDIFKLSTRIEKDVERIDQIISAYIHGDMKFFAKKLFMGGGRSVSYRVAGIFSLVEYPEDYIIIRNKCNNRCSNCTYCKTLWEKAEKRYDSMLEEEKPSPEDLFFRNNSPGYPV